MTINFKSRKLVTEKEQKEVITEKAKITNTWREYGQNFLKTKYKITYLNFQVEKIKN